MSRIYADSEVFFLHLRKYYINTRGEWQLAQIQQFSRRVFRRDGFEIVGASDAASDADNAQRSARRAYRNAYDLICNNHALDAFVTLTFSPELVENKQDAAECYSRLRSWLSNGVQRRGLRYVCVPEYTRAGDIHYHVICNGDAVKTVVARNPSGNPIGHKGKPVYNVSDWKYGYSTMQRVTAIADGANPRIAVAKYMFKYITKDYQKNGGRYFYIGGSLTRPMYVYGDSISDLSCGAEPLSRYERDIVRGGENVETYTECVFRVD